MAYGGESNPGKAKVLPHNMDAEQVLLGAILLDNLAFDSVGDFLEPEHFFEKFHAQLFGTMRAALRVGNPVAIDTVLTLLSLPANHPVCGTQLALYLHKLNSEGCSAANAGDYGRHIRDLSVRRELIVLAEDITKQAHSAPADANARTQIEDVEKRLYALAEHHVPNTGFMPFAETLARTTKMAGEAYARGGGLAGIPTGFHDLDHKMGGLQRSDLIIIGGRPGMGKTALATNIAYNVARTWKGQIQPDGTTETLQGGRVGFFSLEMSAEQIGTRIVSDQTGIDSSKIRRGQFNETEFAQIKDVERERAHVPLHIDESGGLNVAQVCSRARRLKRQHGLDLMVIDYLQLMAGGKNRRDNRTQELTEITSSLKSLAKELQVPIIALSQLSRQVEGRDDKRPQLSDLRESGSIEQDADVVMFVFREAYYLELREPKEGSEEHIKWQTEMAALANRADVILAKQRHGWTGAVEMHFDRRYTRFGDAAHADRLPDPGGPMGEPDYRMDGVPF